MLKNEINIYSTYVKNTKYFEDHYNNYLLIKGYTYRLNDDKQRLFYTFQEAVYALDLARLTKDDEGIRLNSFVYMLIIKETIAEYLNEDINIEEKNLAIEYYKNEQTKRSSEDSKYHMYQY